MAKQDKYSDVILEGSEDEGYSVSYTNLLGRRTSLRLDAEDYLSAKSEASSYLGVPEGEIEDE